MQRRKLGQKRKFGGKQFTYMGYVTIQRLVEKAKKGKPLPYYIRVVKKKSKTPLTGKPITEYHLYTRKKPMRKWKAETKRKLLKK